MRPGGAGARENGVEMIILAQSCLLYALEHFQNQPCIFSQLIMSFPQICLVHILWSVQRRTFLIPYISPFPNSESKFSFSNSQLTLFSTGTLEVYF